MPEDASHNHADPGQHRFACELRAAATLDLREQIPEPVLFGEIDVAGTIAVMAIAFPESGFVVFDITDPARPVYRSRFRSEPCETETDLDCGADVKLSPDGKTAFLAIQRASSSRLAESRRTKPGIAVVDISDPAKPVLQFFHALAPVGVHMLAYHQIQGRPYIVARVRGLGPVKRLPGVSILAVEGNSLRRVSDIPTQGAHDVFLFDDPSDGKTYLYISGAQAGGLFIYDVTDPARPGQVGSWSPRPEVQDNLWYMHNAWTFRLGSRRLTFAGAELYTKAGSLEAGHGTIAGPLWLVDTTDHRRPVMIGEWRNPGRHAAGDLTFSPHSTWYAGDGITWTSHYHGGVWLLDWTQVFEGASRRPRELAYHVPHVANRPFVTSDAKEKFITAPGLMVRPLIWDIVARGRYGFASDINGGLVVLERPRPRPAGPSTPAGDGSDDGAFPVATAVALSAVTVLLFLGAVRIRGRPRNGER